jgi:hypothetical protein
MDRGGVTDIEKLAAYMQTMLKKVTGDQRITMILHPNEMPRDGVWKKAPSAPETRVFGAEDVKSLVDSALQASPGYHVMSAKLSDSYLYTLTDNNAILSKLEEVFPGKKGETQVYFEPKYHRVSMNGKYGQPLPIALQVSPTIALHQAQTNDPDTFKEAMESLDAMLRARA